jgi:hypothetical protein
MAGDWIKITHAAPDKPEMVLMSDLLALDQDAVFGKCVRLWIWADQQTISGEDLTVTPTFIDRLVSCAGFSAALIKVGWLAARSGRLSIPNFARHNGHSAKSRALNQDRMKRSRADQNRTENAPEKRRGEKNVTPNGVTYPAWLEPLWEEWATYKRERGEVYKPTGERGCRRKLTTMGQERASAAIDHSIANNYSGIYEPSGGHGSPARTQAGVARIAAPPGKYAHLDPPAGTGAAQPIPRQVA